MPSLTRRQLLATTVATGVTGTVLTRVGGTAHDPTEADGWRHPQATPGNTSVSTATGPTTAESPGWQYTIPTSQLLRFRGLARYEDTLLVPTHRRLFGISTDGDRRFETAPGRDARFDIRAQLDSDPHILGDTCFVTAGVSVYALNASTGRPRWRFDANSSIDGIVLLGNTIYLSALVGDTDALVAIDATSGEQRWRREGRLVPLAADRGLLVTAEYDTGTLRGYDPATGDQRWSSDLAVSAPSLTRAAVALTSDTLWHVHNGSITAADPTSGEQRWRESLVGDGSQRGERYAVADAVYVLEPDTDQLTAFEQNGERRWSRAINDAAHGVAVDGNTVYAATGSGLEAVAVDTGDTRFRIGTESAPGGALTPLIEDGTVYGVAGNTVFGVIDR